MSDTKRHRRAEQRKRFYRQAAKRDDREARRNREREQVRIDAAARTLEGRNSANQEASR